MATIFIPRIFGGTITYTLPGPPGPADTNALAMVRSGQAAALVRSGQATALVRSGQNICKVRKE